MLRGCPRCKKYVKDKIEYVCFGCGFKFYKRIYPPYSFEIDPSATTVSYTEEYIMTMPNERFRSLAAAGKLLNALALQTAKIPTAYKPNLTIEQIIEESKWISRHYPSRPELEMIAEATPSWLEIKNENESAL